MQRSRLALCAATLVLLGGCGASPPPVDAARIENPSPTEWLSHGRAYVVSEARKKLHAAIADESLRK